MTDALIRGEVPRPAALLRDFVNTLDVDEGTDELDTPRGLADFLRRQGLLGAAARATERHRKQALRLRAGLHEALELNHAAVSARVAALDEALAEFPVRLEWTGSGVGVAPVRDGAAGALARVALAAHEALASEYWWRLKICAFDECQWAYYDQSKNRSRSYCEYGCGNKLKTRAYRARQRAATATSASR